MQEKIKSDLFEALKKADKDTINALKQLSAAISNYQISVGKTVKLTEAQLISVVRKIIAQCNDSISMFEKGNRLDLVEQEKIRISVLEKYLPAEIPENEIKTIIDKAIAETQAFSLKDMGKVMSIVKQKTEGRVDGAKLSALIKVRLNG